jgi:hypothetical protein
VLNSSFRGPINKRNASSSQVDDCLCSCHTNHLGYMSLNLFDIPILPPLLSLQTLDVNDIAEVRLGTHSIGFVRTSCTDKFREVRTYTCTVCGLRVDLPMFICCIVACRSVALHLHSSLSTYSVVSVRCLEMQSFLVEYNITGTR